MLMTNIADLDRKAVAYSVTIVSKATADDLLRPTPCADWNLAQLLAHMSAQHRGFAAAARGRGADPSAWRVTTAADPVADYLAAAADVDSAFSESDVLQRVFDLPEFGSGFTAPGEQAIGFHLIDYIVHGWDVARSLDLPYELDAELVEPALRVARAVPDGELRTQAGSPFAPAVPNPDGADPLAEILAWLGRSPNWPDPVK